VLESAQASVSVLAQCFESLSTLLTEDVPVTLDEDRFLLDVYLENVVSHNVKTNSTTEPSKFQLDLVPILSAALFLTVSAILSDLYDSTTVSTVCFGAESLLKHRTLSAKVPSFPACTCSHIHAPRP